MPARNLRTVQRPRANLGLDAQGYVDMMIQQLRTLHYIDPRQDRYRVELLHWYEGSREPARLYQEHCLERDLAQAEGRTPPPVAA